MGDGAALPEATRQRLVPALRKFPGVLILLAWDGEHPVGTAVCFTGFSTFRARPLINIHDLAVLPSHRRLGVGTRLLEAVANEARARGCCKLTLEVREDNLAAQALYRKAGFGPGSSARGPKQSLFLERQIPESVLWEPGHDRDAVQ
jgi:GNAT superfamily N-acetyltransferase